MVQKNAILLIAGLLWRLHLNAQNDTLAQYFARYIQPESLSKHLYVLASDSLEGRKTATEGQKKLLATLPKKCKKSG